MINNSSNGYNARHNNKNNSHMNNEQIHEKSKKIMEVIENSDNSFKEFNELMKLDENKKNFFQKNNYYLINKKWLINFKNFAKSKDSNFPGKIENGDIIIQDDKVLKFSKETRIFFNNKKDFDQTCLFIKEDLWNKLLNLFGGGPKYLIIPNNEISTNLVIEGGHINLIYIHNKKYILKNTRQNFIFNNYVFFNLNRDVNSLKNYINKILNSNKKKFKINKAETLEESKHYRLWLYSGFSGQADSISEYLSEKISFFFKRNNSQNDLINWKNFDKMKDGNEYNMILLSNFNDNKIKDIFPNNFTKNFNRQVFNKYKYKDNYDLPLLTIIIEENPYIFETENKIYKIGKCFKCNFSEIIFCSCECQKLFFCSKVCADKKIIEEHFKVCKIFLTKKFKEENNEFSKEKSEIYSLIGLLNLGNTCYMNSALQCIRSIKELSNYFINYFNETHLNVNNILGTGGFLTLAYANFLYHLNKCQKEYYIPQDFKNSIGIVDDRYSGRDQQDTHEFMNFLIDSLHEDLNRVINKPIIKRKDSDINNIYSYDLYEKEKSIIEWNNHLKRNQSIIVDLFYGQYKTTISCPSCNYKSINFSIFCSQQLPIPKKEYFIIKVNFMEEEPNSLPTVKLNIIINKQNNKIFNAKQILGNILEISPHQIEIINYKNKDITKIYENEEEINENTNNIWAIKINLETIEIIGENQYSSNRIDYSKLKENFTKKRDDIIKIFENYNPSDNINDKKINYEQFGLEKFIFKYYIFSSTISNDVLCEDSLIYLPTNITCSDLYYKIFEIYDKIGFLNKYSEIVNKEYNKNEIFQIIFKDFIETESNKNELTNDIFEKYKRIPFFLKLEVNSINRSIYIPPSKEYIFKNFIKNNLNVEQENINIIRDEIEKGLNEFGINININTDPNQNDNGEQINENKISSIGNNNERDCFNENNFNVDNLNDFHLSSNQLKDINNNANEPNDIKINITKDKSEEGKNNEIKKILIICNIKYLKNDESEKNSYLLKKTSSEAIDLLPFTQKIFETNFQKILIDKCFEEFSKEETFDKDNLWKCPKCEKDIEAKNKIEIYQVPKILVLQLKRFKNNKKIETLINFPLKDLDMSKFISPSTLSNNNIPLKYDLFAVANHYGRLDYGHYDAFCLNYIDNNWYNFNDRIVTKIKKEEEEKEIITNNAYVLFYKQQKIDLIDWEKIYNKKFENITDNNYKKFGEDFIYEKENTLDINLDEIDAGINTTKYINEENINEEETFDQMSLNSYIYNPFKESYLKLKRNRKKSIILK